MSPFYTKLKADLAIREELLAFARECPFVSNGYVFSKEVPASLVERDSVLAKLVDDLRIPLVRMFWTPAFSWYRWHTDMVRSSSINSLLVGDGHALFAKGKVIPDIVSVEELVYEPRKMYLFDTQKPHSVTTLGRDRIILTLSLPQGVSYAKAHEQCAMKGWL